MINFLVVAIKFIFLLGFLVLIHEGGHFIVAKLCKVRVNEFAIGFGPVIAKKRTRETKYTLRLLPVGGYVSLEGETINSESKDSFNNKSIPKRIAIISAGAIVNIVFGLIVYFVIASSVGEYYTCEVARTTTEYSDSQELMGGDKITKVNNKVIHIKQDIDKALANLDTESIEIEVERNNEKVLLNIKPSIKVLKNTGIYFNASNDSLTSNIKLIEDGSPAQIAGLKVKDKIIKVNGEEVNNNPYKVIELTQKIDEEISYTVIRDDKELIFTLKPDLVKRYYLNIEYKKINGEFIENINNGFWLTVNFSSSIIDNLKRLFSGQVGMEQLTGPIGISSLVAETNGIKDFFYLMALISLSLGVTNLLPIPPLDGWKIILYLIEGIRRKPLSEKTLINIEMLGFAFMIILSIYVAYSDILRI